MHDGATRGNVQLDHAGAILKTIAVDIAAGQIGQHRLALDQRHMGVRNASRDTQAGDADPCADVQHPRVLPDRRAACRRQQHRIEAGAIPLGGLEDRQRVAEKGVVRYGCVRVGHQVCRAVPCSRSAPSRTIHWPRSASSRSCAARDQSVIAHQHAARKCPDRSFHDADVRIRDVQHDARLAKQRLDETDENGIGRPDD